MSYKTLCESDFSKICRICLETSSNLLFMAPDLLRIYNNVTNILANEHENLPQNVCTDCKKELENMENFINKCNHNLSVLLKILSNDYSTGNENSEKSNDVDDDDSAEDSSSTDEAVYSVELIDNEESNMEQDQLQENPDKTALCEICDKTYSNLANLRRHKKTFHWLDQLDNENKRIENKVKKKNVSNNVNDCVVLDRVNNSAESIKTSSEQECKICKKLIPKAEFMSHVNEHLPKTIKAKAKHKKQYICSFCNKDMKTKSHLDVHLRTHTGARPFECKICVKSFATNTTLVSHLMQHTGEKPYLCDQCARLFRSKKSLEIHMAVHTNEKKFQCDCCGKQYYYKNDLHKHLSTVHREQFNENLECSICNKTFNNSYRYKLHVNSHSEERKYLCTTCGKSFKTKGVLIAHSMIHTGETPYICNCCSKGFISKSYMKEHIRRHHTGEQPYVCNICYKRYYDGTNLRRHKQRNHP